MNDTNQARIKFINNDDGTEISATSIRVVLPDNASFLIESEPGREGSVVFIMPWGSLEDKTFHTFSIEPGGGNLFSVNVIEFARRTD